jgi:metal-responsive CopG/Arc/MetJ family transcriptional regulator
MLSAMRTVIDVPDQLIESLDRVSSTEQRSRAALIREAIAEFLRKRSGPSAEAAFGLWKDRKTDGLRYQNGLRAEWQNR